MNQGYKKVLYALIVFFSSCIYAYAEEPPVVAAAADLKYAMEEIERVFQYSTGKKVVLSFGSAGNFYRQIMQGAPFQFFMSADEQFIFNLAKDGFVEDEGALYAIGRIVLFTPHGSPLKADPKLQDLKAAIEDGRVEKIAIPNPEHAPYGKRAKEALMMAGLWERIEPKLVLGDNMIQATQFATQRLAQGGILAYSFALAPEITKLGTFSLIPEDWHQPLRQRMALIKGAGQTAREFYAFVQTPQAREILRRFGFVLPGEAG